MQPRRILRMLKKKKLRSSPLTLMMRVRNKKQSNNNRLQVHLKLKQVAA